MSESTQRGCVVACAIGATACGFPPLPALIDAAGAETPHVLLTWQVAATSPSGAPEPKLEYPAWDAATAPQVRIAPIDGPLVVADYSTSPATPGWIFIPRAYVAMDTTGNRAPWRLEYRLPDEPPHEIQWAPEPGLGHLVVPIAGRIDRSSAPVGGGYLVTPSNPPASYNAPRVLTTGLWTDGLANPSGSAIDYDFSVAVPLSGRPGRPDPTKGDRAYAVDFMLDAAPCRFAIGGAPLTSAALTPGTHTAQAVTWETARRPINSDTVDFALIDRLRTALGKLHGAFNANGSGILYGAAPGTVGGAAFPALTGSSAAFELPIPVMQILVQCPYNASLLPPAVLPSQLDQFPVVLHVQLLDTRRVGTINLHSGLETVLTPTSGGFKMIFPAPMPTGITLATPSAAAPLDLAGDADQVAAGAPTGPFRLAFTTEATVAQADYFDVFLHKLASDTLTTERIYTVTAPEVRIDPSVLVGGAEYVFEIRSFKGQPTAPRGDFTLVQFPYGSAVVFTRTFKTS